MQYKRSVFLVARLSFVCIDARTLSRCSSVERVDFIDGQVLDREEGSGGAINVVGNNWHITYRYGSMSGNRAKFGGAMFVSASDLTTVQIHDLVIAENTAYRNGGIVYILCKFDHIRLVKLDRVTDFASTC